VLRNIIKRILCKHLYREKIRTIHGDEIIRINMRSEWICMDCGKFMYSKKLNEAS